MAQSHKTERQPGRRPLRIPWGEQQPDGTWVDGDHVLTPGDDGYDDAYQTALFWHTEAGQPMPYADDADADADATRDEE